MSLPPNTNTQELIRIEQLLDAGNFKEALQAVEILEQRDDLPPTDRLAWAVFDIALITSLGITVYEDYAQQPIDTDSPVASQLSGDVIIPADLVEILPKEIQIDIIKAQTCFEFCNQSPHPIYEAYAMYLRKVLATTIVIRFQRDGKDKKLYNKDHQPFKLKAMVELAKQENYISSSFSKQLMRIKWMGDIGVHDYKIKLKETDIQPIFQLMRFTSEHLFYNNQN